MDNDLFCYLGQKVEVTIHRKRYKHNTRTCQGTLTDITVKMICIEKSNGKFVWMPKPSYYRDTIKLVDK